MTMLGAMYAPSDRVTLMLMATHIENTMTLKTYHAMNKTLLGSKSRSEGPATLQWARSFAAE